MIQPITGTENIDQVIAKGDVILGFSSTVVRILPPPGARWLKSFLKKSASRFTASTAMSMKKSQNVMKWKPSRP